MSSHRFLVALILLATPCMGGTLEPDAFGTVADGPIVADLEARRAWIVSQPRTFENEVLFRTHDGEIVRSDRFTETSGLFGDFDGDGDIDRYDYTALQICLSFSGPAVPTPPACFVFDSDGDQDIDMADVAAFASAMTGSLSTLHVEAGELVPILASPFGYYSGEPGTSGSNALNGIAAQAGYAQDDLWYRWRPLQRPVGSGDIVVANASRPTTAYTILSPVLRGSYRFQLTVTNLITGELGFDVVTLSVVDCFNDADCDDGDACTDDACVNNECWNTPVDCDDSVACTDDACYSGTCTHTDNCTGGQSCNRTTGLCAESLTAVLAFAAPVVVPNSQTTVTATVQGGTTPYTVCFKVAGGGSLSGGAAGCGPIDDFTICDCTAPFEVQYQAPGGSATATVIAKVRDAVGGIATAVASVNVTGGGGGFTITSVTATPPALCAGGIETTTIAVSTAGGSGNTFMFNRTGTPLAGETLTPEGAFTASSTAVYKSPTVGGSQVIEVTGRSGGGSQATSNVTINITGGCGDSNACTSDVCTNGVCSNPPTALGTACGSATDTECDNPDTCDGTGVCLANHEPALTSCGSPTNDACTNPDSCDGLGACVANNVVDGALCDSDGVDCTSDACQAGVCEHPFKAIGAACGNPLDNVCNRADTCDGAGVCLTNFSRVDTPCGNQATTDCTNPDTCDGAGVCGANDFAPGTVICNDGLFCNGADTCSGGACSIHSGDPCPAPLVCDERGVCVP